MITRDSLIIIILMGCWLMGFALKLINKEKSSLCLCYFIPLVASGIHLSTSKLNILMIVIYGESILLALLYFFRRKKIFYFLISSIMIVGVLVVKTWASYNFSSLNYVEAFKGYHQLVKRNYVFRGWKAIDFDEKYNEYIGEIEKAEKDQDCSAYVNALRKYMSSYEDGHMQIFDYLEYLGLGSTRNIQNANVDFLKNYYGMSILRLDQGDYVAVNVVQDGSAYKMGIREGDKILKWDGKTIEEQIREYGEVIPVNCRMFGNQENEELYTAFFIAETGGECVEISFISQDGEEKIVKISTMGNGYKYLYDTIGKFDHKVKETSDITYKISDRSYGYIKIIVEDEKSQQVKENIQTILQEMKDAQVKTLIMDLRNNKGGEDETGAAIVSQFAKENMVYLKETTYNDTTQAYDEHKVIEVMAEQQIDVPIIVLVNSQCISAGEGLAYNMSRLDNVKCAGMTTTNGSFGTITGMCLMPDGIVLTYPSIACTDESGKVMIDSGVDGIGGVVPQIKIPINQEAVHTIFGSEEDYELDYVLKTLQEESLISE